MLTNYFKVAFRNLVKRKYYAAINIFGLSLGITCAIFLYLFINYHLSFDSYHKKAANTFRVVNELYFDKTLHEKGASIGMYKALSSNLSKVTDAAVLLGNYSFTVTVDEGQGGERRFREEKNIAIASASWFKIFDYAWLEGSAAGLELPNTMVITKAQSLKYFGKEDPLGKTIVLDNHQPVKIVGLLDDKPANTDLKAPFFISFASLKNLYPTDFSNFTNDWGWMNSTTALYVTLAGSNASKQVEAEIAALAKNNLGDNAKYYHFWLQPLSDIHFNLNYGGAIQKSLLFTLSLIGLLILLIASFNYINISIAQQSRRMTEIGTRKVLGGTNGQVFLQLIIETIITAGVAGVISVLTVSALLPVANSWLFTQEPLHFLSYQRIGLFLALLLVGLVLLSGFYPAFILSRIDIFNALKSKGGGWKAGLGRKTLVVFQNTIACVFIICAVVMVLQVRFLRNTDIGFKRDAVVMLPMPDSSQAKKELMRNELQPMPQISAFSFCRRPPSAESSFGGSVKYDTRSEWEAWPAQSPVGDSAYLHAFGLQLLAGRNLRETAAQPEYLVNETMVHKLGLKNTGDVLGKAMVAGQFGDRKGVVVGVVKDFNTQSLQVPIEPIVIAYVPESFTAIALKLNTANLAGVLDIVRKKWEQVYPQQVFKYSFLDDQIAALYQKEDLQQRLFFIAGTVAIIISCLGLLGLVSLVTLQRTKEIGIRKVIGASAINITAMLSKDFFNLVFISVLIASPLAWWITHEWLKNFAYRIEVHWWIFAGTGLFSIAVAIITVSYQSIKAALANPVDSLKTE